MKKHIPNIITLFRIILLPIFIYLVLKENFLAGGFVFIIAAFSDLLDGYLARKWKVISNFGKLADPLADKAIQISAIILLCILGKLHFVLGIILAIKEFLMILGSYLLYKNKIVVYALWFGKIAALTINTAIAFILIFNPNILVSNIFVGAALTIEIIALILYTKRYFELKRQADKPGESG